MSSIDHLHSETKMLLVEDLLNLISAQYLVHCLDTENVCHHITTLDHPPKEMKETLFTRHNQTVVPLLANTKKASLQAVHTSFVNSAIYNMTNNRVLNCRPPAISDEEIYLTRRQRTTLSQLRSGHCKLLNSYKKSLKQTDSSSCPDCGMDPQYVPHLFNCTAHPTALTPESLWDRLVKTIREPGLTTRMVERGIQQQQHNSPQFGRVWSVVQCLHELSPCFFLQTGRWSEPRFVFVCQLVEVIREADANETSEEDGLALPGSLVGKSQLKIPKLEADIIFSNKVPLISVEFEYHAEWCALKSPSIRVSVVIIRWSRSQGTWPDVSKMRYFLKQDNWICIINNQLKFDI